MLHPDWLCPARPVDGLHVVRAEVPSPDLNRFFYTAVGADWWWTDRLEWTDERWLAHLDRPQVETWVGYVSGTPVGYFELEGPPPRGDKADARGDVEIAYFGLLPQFVGRGIGGALLTAAVQRAWTLAGEARAPGSSEPAAAAGRVWLHTCSLDSPRALANYRARGFRLDRTETQRQTLPHHGAPR
ncbi:MAG: GNAT family N-acetyltransferase [Chloroflexota bacterium]|nr:GNAT family N-acetyltransferase [Chloroflexota bacterium]